MDRRIVVKTLGLGAGLGLLPFKPMAYGQVDRPVVKLPYFGDTGAIYTQLQSMRAQAHDIRRFGARLNGTDDDSAALEAALAAVDVKVLLIPAMPEGQFMRLTREIRITRPVAIVGEGSASLIKWESNDARHFVVRPEGDNPTAFVRDVWFDNLRIERADAKRAGHVARCTNVRGLRLTRCSTQWMGGLYIDHMYTEFWQRQKLSITKRGLSAIDPAVTMGFSPNSTDDLNEDILVLDNQIKAGSYKSDIIRFNFAKRVAVVGNSGDFANISWWGGGAKRGNGGEPQHLRRVRDVYIADNKVNRCNGGIYGNNGQNVLIERNEVWDIVDTGIDFEGCMDSVAQNNISRNCGNFCYSVFYLSRNIKFLNNLAIQDGSAKHLSSKIGGKKIGAELGRAAFALRCAGYAEIPEAVTVEVKENTFEWHGSDGLGSIVPSYSSRLVFDRNRFVNVACNLTNVHSALVEITGNQFLFDRAADKPIKLIGAGRSQAGGIRIKGNVLTVKAAQPAGSSGIYAIPIGDGSLPLEISGNEIHEQIPGQLEFPILIEDATKPTAFKAKNLPTKLKANNKVRSVHYITAQTVGVKQSD